MFHLKLKDTLKHSIATVTSHMDSFVYNPGRDYSRIRKLSPDHVISFLISQGASSTKCEFLDFFQMSEDLPSISALNQRRSQMMPEALEAVFHEFTSSSEKLELSKQEQQYQYIAADGSTTSFFSFSKRFSYLSLMGSVVFCKTCCRTSASFSTSSSGSPTFSLSL